MKKVLSSLDSIANKLQNLGHARFAEQIDVITNTLIAAVQQEKELRVPLMELPQEVKDSGSGDQIQQGFISEAPNCDVRIRKRGE